MTTEFILNEMSKDEIDKVKEKYKKAIDQTLILLKDSQTYGKISPDLNITYKWDDINHFFNA